VDDWQKAVTEATDGNVRFNVLPQPVASPADHYNAIRDGLADVGVAVAGYTPGRFPLTKLVEMPANTHTAEASSAAFYRLVKRTPVMQAEFKDVKILALFVHGPGQVFNTRKPIKSMDDLRSLKYRVGGGVVSDVAQVLGVNASQKPATESYELIANGVVDGAWLPMESLETYNLMGLIKYVTAFQGGLYSSAMMVVMNKARWKDLSDEDKQSIQALSGVPFSRDLGRRLDERDTRAREHAVEAGIQVDPAPRSLVQEVGQRSTALLDNWRTLARDKGIQDPDAVIQRYRKDLEQ
tara:strand:- start:11290 stop:12174 length:885 start_codon:yes stop_codon:yes gene_type:complete